MDALDAELYSNGPRTKPEIKTNINKDTGSVFLVCPWNPSSVVEPADVVKFACAIEEAFRQEEW
jgi:hypothetical protein